jgi:hypothetical protein
MVLFFSLVLVSHVFISQLHFGYGVTTVFVYMGFNGFIMNMGDLGLESTGQVRQYL